MSRRNGRHAPTKTTGFRFDVHYQSLLTEKAAAYGMSPGRYARQVLMEHLTHADQEAAQLALARAELLPAWRRRPGQRSSRTGPGRVEAPCLTST
jgi:hypothetical protein